ncbi:hypothetical protein C7H83_11320 [Tetragenococcus halophilus]|uniref:Lantibiotic biosynthesis protein n=1 Tax=Tetragenococcus halophilus TaxID=51669 RepID=A0A3G5FLJ3_TETHA|nr:lanthionine synthetase LanC family protein [Tetragenococcus halophilus]AYW51018.1 hypothetical protein C7H83_11320 [Tetragenococcus halophilus]GBD64810.1 hypothetical protein TEHD23766T_2237 [Tetragenococcus halophilus subsp. flandriensis]
MINTEYRENFITKKVIERCNVYDYLNPNEVTNLMRLDIPMYLSKTTSLDIFGANKTNLRKIYKQCPLKFITSRVEALNLSEIEFQKNVLINATGANAKSIGKFHFNKVKPGNIAEELVNVLYNQSFVFSESHQISWLSRRAIGVGENYSFSPIPVNLYDGLLGIYMFLFYEQGVHSNKKELLDIIWNSIKIQFQNKENRNFQNLLDMLYVLLIKYKESNENKVLKQIYFTIDLIMKDETYLNSLDDMLIGKSGLLMCLSNLYEITKSTYVLKVANKVCHDIMNTTNDKVGIAHGISGVVIALQNYYVKCKKSSSIPATINQLLSKERKRWDSSNKRWHDQRKNDNSYLTEFWCNGEIGIAHSRLVLLEQNYKDSKLRLELEAAVNNVLFKSLRDDTLCHGNLGIIYFLQNLLNSKVLNKLNIEKHKVKVYYNKLLKYTFQHNINLSGVGTFCENGLYTGVSGAGVVLIRDESFSKIPDFLIKCI